MNLKRIKTILPAAMLTLSAGLFTTSCVGDLDVENINPQQTSILNADALFNKIYASFVLTGQTGPAGNGDLADIDEGRSEFFRMSWYLNEFTTDEAHWIWSTDAGVPDLLHNTYDADNIFSAGLYYRLYFTITLCNYYLDEVADDGSTESARRRAEVRFIRALNYYYVMDMYANAAFIEHVSTTPGERYTRQQFFDYVKSELEAIENDMAEAGQNTYGRVDKVANWLLQSRLYLNAEVYTGTPMWTEAKTYADKVINNGYYKLMTNGATNPVTGEQYSAYQMLFLADNNENGAQYEAIFPVMCDGLQTQSYGAMDFLILSCYSGDMSTAVPSGTDNSWGKCARVRGKLIDIFFGSQELPQTSSIATITGLANDDRALFYTDGFTRVIEDESEAAQGYGCVKFRNVRSDGKGTSALTFVDTDLPLMRIAEAYLTYAEAETRLNGQSRDAKLKIDALRNRAHASVSSNYSLDDIRDEWAKEFWFEGRRRMDLVRFGCFGGQNNYKWEWMGNGDATGSQFYAFRNIFAIPSNDLTNNPNLVQNPEY